MFKKHLAVTEFRAIIEINKKKIKEMSTDTT